MKANITNYMFEGDQYPKVLIDDVSRPYMEMIRITIKGVEDSPCVLLFLDNRDPKIALKKFVDSVNAAYKTFKNEN